MLVGENEQDSTVGVLKGWLANRDSDLRERDARFVHGSCRRSIRLLGALNDSMRGSINPGVEYVQRSLALG